MKTLRTYENQTYTRTVELIPNSKKCEEYGYTKTVKVITLSVDPRNPEAGKTILREERWWTNDVEDYRCLGHKYFSKRK